jgi:hypothetical protein
LAAVGPSFPSCRIFQIFCLCVCLLTNQNYFHHALVFENERKIFCKMIHGFRFLMCTKMLVFRAVFVSTMLWGFS